MVNAINTMIANPNVMRTSNIALSSTIKAARIPIAVSMGVFIATLPSTWQISAPASR